MERKGFRFLRSWFKRVWGFYIAFCFSEEEDEDKLLSIFLVFIISLIKKC